jgi:transcriptional regulator with XRE-family HTH domain
MNEEPSRLFDWLTKVHKQWPGWNQKRLAEECHVTPNTMRGWRDGSKPDRATLAAIASAVGVSVEALHRVMAGRDIPVPPAPPARRHLAPVPDGDESDDFASRLERLEQRVENLTDLVLRALRSEQ